MSALRPPNGSSVRKPGSRVKPSSSTLKSAKYGSTTSGPRESVASVGGKSGRNISKMSTKASRRMRSSRSGSRRRKKKEDSQRVFDTLGRDVTPKSLIVASAKTAQLNGGSLASLSVDKAMQNANLSDSQDDLDSITESLGSAKGPAAVLEAAKEASVKAEAEPEATQEKRVPTPRKLTEKELRESVTVKFLETETFDLLYVPGTRVWQEDETLHDAITKKNASYEMMLQRQRTEKDKFSARHAQTFNLSLRSKEIQASPPATMGAGVQITTWGIYDAYNEQPTEGDVVKDLLTAGRSSSQGEVTTSGAVGGNAGASVLTMSGSRSGQMDQSAFQMQQSEIIKDKPLSMGRGLASNTNNFERISKLPAFKQACDILEQAVLQNRIRDKQSLYRSHEDKASTAADSSSSRTDEFAEASARADPRLVPLWSYTCPCVEDLPVSALCFNKQNSDLLVAAYGRLDFGNTSNTNAGVILFWSMKNPEFPVKQINTKHSVTSIDFCTEHPHLLAAGMYNGSVAIYDIRDDNDRPALESAHATGKHSEPVWGVKWVAKESSQRAQHLCSISTDGSVQQWSMKKGLVPKELMQLKRIPNRAQFQGSHMEGISREASGLCFDFPLTDGTQYLAGTEDGLLHKCSVSYNEQTLENYYGHTGPVYKVRVSPHLPEAFLSCSADWTCALWTQKSTSPVLSFQSGHDYIVDIQWAPANSCVFGTVSRDGRVEVWDVESSPLDPVIKHQIDHSALSCVLFAPDSPVILTGAHNGVIEVYRVTGVAEYNHLSAEKQASRLKEAMYANNNEAKNSIKSSDQREDAEDPEAGF